ncbi:MAG: CsgG/HfaB family protein [Deltaproteobacteria bacterium]|nr:CsgG/HfaB family protein [Deltaproteobacteria bacterium]
MKKVVSKILAVLLLAISSAAQAGALPKQGPKPRVAVSEFGATDRFTAAYGGWNIGGGLAAQMVTSLIDSNRVLVVERAILSKVLIEQELGQSRLSSPLTQTPSGQLLGVDYLIVGQVTEFEERQMGGGSSLAIMKGFGPKLSGDAVAAHVAIDLRVIDSRTGEILHSHRSQGRAWDKSIGTKIDYKFIEFGGEFFHKTPLGKATRAAIGDAVNFILQVIEKRNEELSWLARVIDVDGPNVYFDAGRGANIVPGDQFIISAVQKVLTDPETNEILGLVEQKVGLVQAVQVESKYTRSQTLGNFRPRLGDLVRFAQEKGPASASNASPTSYRIME